MITMSLKKATLVSALQSREIELSSYRRDRITSLILANLITKTDRTFKYTWSRWFKQGACLGMDRRMYIENLQTVYCLDGYNGALRCMYSLTPSTAADEVIGGMLYYLPVRREEPSAEEKESVLLVLTNDGYLKVINADTGFVLRSIFLSKIIKYRLACWADYEHTIQVESGNLQSQQIPGVPSHHKPVQALIIFKTHPIRLMASMIIDKHIFGKDAVDGSVKGGILMIYHSRNKYCLYNFEMIVKNHSVLSGDIGDEVNVNGNWGVIGQPGFGIPITIKLNEPPPVIFKVTTNMYVYGNVDFGDAPFVYIQKHPHCFQVKDFLTSTTVGEIRINDPSETIMFHNSNYQRLFHTSGPTVSCYQLTLDSKLGTIKMDKLWKRNFALSASSQFHIRGRIKQTLHIVNKAGMEVKIRDIDYKDELELLCVVVTRALDFATIEAHLHFIDDDTGSTKKLVSLPEWDAFGDNTIHYELDVILHEVMTTDGFSLCYLYRLTSAK